MKAVLLAAGRGSRLGAPDLPKPLCEIGPRGPDDSSPVSLLERQILCLKRAGVEHVGVIVGWNKHHVIDRVAPLSVTCIENTHPDIRASGTSHSLQFAAGSPFEPFGGREPLLILDGDLVYEQALLDTIVRDAKATSLAVTPGVGGDAEEVRVYGRDDRPSLIGKGLGPPLTDGADLIGEATGIWYVAPPDHAFVRALLTWLVGAPGASAGYGFAGIASEHEELAQYLMHLGRLGVLRLDPELLFMEADFPSDIERIRKELYPEILRRDARS